MTQEMKQVALRDGTLLPKLGQGTWLSGENPDHEAAEIAAFRKGVELGMTLIDTAEGYGFGLAEKFIKKAIDGLDRNDLFIISKVEPPNAHRGDIIRHCQQSLDNMGLDYLDMYLLHWYDPSIVPTAEAVEGLEELVAMGKIKRWGVSNFDLEGLEELWSIPGGSNCMLNQIQYNIGARGIEYDVLPWMKEHGVGMMAYAPMGHGGETRKRMMDSEVLHRVAERHGLTMMQFMLAFTLQRDDVIAIPRHELPEHAEWNFGTQFVTFTQEDWDDINSVFPAPTCHTPLSII